MTFRARLVRTLKVIFIIESLVQNHRFSRIYYLGTPRRDDMQASDWRQRLAAAGLTDNFIFNKTFLDTGLTKELICRVLPDLQVGKLKIVDTQHELATTYDSKGLRFDIYAEDDYRNRFDIEMQVLNRHNLAQRIRFYQSMMAMDSYERGKDYRNSGNAYVIFFCCFEPGGTGDQWYRTERDIHSEGTHRQLSDGEVSLCFDVTSPLRTVNPPLQNFLDLVAGRTVDESDDFIVQLKKRIAFVKQNRKWRREYMLRTVYEMDIEHDCRQAVKEGLKQGLEQGIERGKQQGLEQGASDERLALIRDLIDSGQSADEVINFLTTVRKLPVAEAQKYYHQALTKCEPK